MTPAQSNTLKNAINADPTVSAFVAAHDWPSVAANYNGVASPQVLIWNPNVRADVIMSAIVPADFSGLTVQNALGLLCMLSAGFVDSSSATVQIWFNAMFVGKTTTLTQLASSSQRPASKFEAVFTTNSVCSVYGQQLSAIDVQQAMGF